ncbi:mannose-6-phosphate isomerase, class I [Actinomadura sp. 7K534]|uniref:mannose-6-phosphate isomerase, class I n=1 Tax=Actinomadura sp. 7K534 TaxID=2530366 RepID=UPI001FB5E032|nr:mannose-6-phosphate isomerase, class I [Actinomadura sp. 7K534]
MTAPMPLTTPIRPYDWGSRTALPGLLGTEPTGGPQAELWAGAHPAAPSSVDGTPLNVLIDDDPVGMLGAASVKRFGPALPYLLKVLAVEKPLSLQVHPTMAQAEAGFAAEEERGVPLDHFTRAYKDPYHKPEMVCALTDFHGLCGFREPAGTADHLESLGVPELRPWIETLRAEPPGDALRTVLAQMLDEKSRPILAAVEPALTSVYADIARAHPGDPGVLAALLLNHVELAPGQALFLDAGVPHSYLRGLAIEVMANSDNVLRCGLTGKHVDVPELMRVVSFVPSVPARVEPAAGFRYCPNTDEFSLIRHDLTADPDELPPGLPQTLLCLEGEAHLRTDRTLTLTRGEAAFIPAGAPAVRLTGRGVLYRVIPAIP